MTRMWRAAILVGAWSVAAAAQAPAQEKDGKAPKDEARPEVGLKVSPLIAFSPAKISVRAELKGGAIDYEPFYCNTIVWDWDDGTTSENTPDCAPYEAGPEPRSAATTAARTPTRWRAATTCASG